MLANNQKMSGEIEPEKETADRLMAALQQDEFVLFTQSIVALVPQSVDRAFREIYIRLEEEDAKLLPPGSFFPVLEECGMLPYLDRWVVNRLARFVRAGLKFNPAWSVPRYNVNLSDATLADPKFGTYVLKYVNESYLAGGVLGFEVSFESAVMHREALGHLMWRLRQHGCSLTLSGFDGSERLIPLLKALKADFVKLSALTVDPARVSEINRMCHSLGAKTIAEHIENSRVLEHLRRSKIDFGQGFQISPVEPL